MKTPHTSLPTIHANVLMFFEYKEQLTEKALNDNAYVNRESFDYILITKRKDSFTPRQSTKPAMTNIVWLISSKNLAGINLTYLYLLYQETLFQVTRTYLKLRKVEYCSSVYGGNKKIAYL